MKTPHEHADAAYRTLLAYNSYSGEKSLSGRVDEAVTWLLADLMHLSDEGYGLDLDALIEEAKVTYADDLEANGRKA